jgi:hypothetical protein
VTTARTLSGLSVDFVQALNFQEKDLCSTVGMNENDNAEDEARDLLNVRVLPDDFAEQFSFI